MRRRRSLRAEIRRLQRELRQAKAEIARLQDKLDRSHQALSGRTKHSQKRARIRGTYSGGFNWSSRAKQVRAMEFAETMRELFTQMRGLSANALARELNARQIETAEGCRWSSMQVVRVRRRLAAEEASDSRH